uniref:Secreted protein n=1 Tax=Globodera pallida TaxID=36090 RepID=A0A183C5U5_GLOPA
MESMARSIVLIALFVTPNYAYFPNLLTNPRLPPEHPCKKPGQGFACKSGVFDEHGYGETHLRKCKGRVYCFAMSCKIGKNIYTFWGSAAKKDCDALRDYVGFDYACHCKFGGKGVEKSNINFMLPAYLAPSPLAPDNPNRGTRANISILFVWLMSSAFLLAASASLLKQ